MGWDARRTLYLVTSREAPRGPSGLGPGGDATRGRDLVDLVARAVAAAPARVAVQLRDKDLGGRDLFALAVRLREVCRPHGVPLLVNDRLDVALAAGADGVHLPADALPAAEARRALPAGLVGASCHAPGETRERSGADFVVLGPIHDTPSKRPFGPPLGLGALRVAVRCSPVPVIAIGGIDAANAAAAAGTGCAGVACLSAVWGADDPAAAVVAVVAAFDRGRRRAP